MGVGRRLHAPTFAFDSGFNERGCFLLGMDVEFGVDAPCVRFHRVVRNAERFADVGAVFADGKQVEDLRFAGREAALRSDQVAACSEFLFEVCVLIGLIRFAAFAEQECERDDEQVHDHE